MDNVKDVRKMWRVYGDVYPGLTTGPCKISDMKTILKATTITMTINDDDDDVNDYGGYGRKK